MLNPFLRPRAGLSGIIGKACIAAYDAEVMHYSFLGMLGDSCHLSITRKDQFFRSSGGNFKSQK